MTLRILFFSLLRDVTSSEELLLESPPATVGALLDQLYERYPGLRDWDSRLLIAVDLAFAGREDSLVGAKEVALMPPVQGG